MIIYNNEGTCNVVGGTNCVWLDLMKQLLRSSKLMHSFQITLTPTLLHILVILPWHYMYTSCNGIWTENEAEARPHCHSDPRTTKHWGGGLKVIAGATDKGKAHSDPPNTKHWAGGLKVIAGATDKVKAHSDPPNTKHWAGGG